MTAQPRFEEIVENFELFDDWEDRYRYVIELGREMQPLDDALKIPAHKVEGCASQVWLVPSVTEGEDGVARLDFRGDSDAMIVRGLIAVLHALYSGLPLREAANVDALGELSRLGLEAHLSAQRSNGLKAMVQRIGDLTRAAA
ncbi:SufE family protein [Limibaculum sp. M0105]|uniref:SufE family protein n=1 Tax=Thermohalobaculum xanthum TaxID=2753746 RepID=A0A8J7M571_9RHOB|nr:SufE family protein [Thermohalobaculum xanthum]MBK0397569.1 SufE family protein [Thermohalobaculum xanthum]